MNKPNGFSLVELSIVLVILGLLAGGVLTGQSLIRAAELRSVTTEFSKYQAAVNTFRDKYFALPGDMTNAQSFWGVAHATAATCITTAGTGTQTCNGNGDGIIQTSTGSNESYRLWQHLANTGLIEGSYTGISSGGSMVAGTNAPKAKMSNGAWQAWSAINYAGDGSAYALDYGSLLGFGVIAAGTDTPQNAILKPEEAWNIDTKIDDGKPARGSVIARFWNNLCAAADDGTHDNNDLAASYRLTDSTV